MGAIDSRMISAGTSTTFHIVAAQAADGSELVCDATCTVYCYSGTGCNNMTLSCKNGGQVDIDCFFTFNCAGAAKSSVCTDGYQLPSGFQYYDFRQLELSTLNNSQKLCNRNISNSTSPINCDSYQDPQCYRANELVTTANQSVPLCCTGTYGCAISDGIIASVDNIDEYDDIALRIDSTWGAAITRGGWIRAPKGGHIFVTGYVVNAVNDAKIEGNGEYDIFVTGL